MMAELARLSPEHLAMLREGSGLSDEIIAERGYYTETTFKGLRDLGFSERQSNAPALVVPLHNVDGRPAGFQIRPDDPRSDEDGKVIKYETPKGSSVVLDVPPRCQAMLANPSTPLYVTEGAKKADALADQGLCAISLLGVWNWRGTNTFGGKTFLPDWDSIALNERLVRVVFDSDVAIKREVAFAMMRLKGRLEGRDAVVELIYLPPTDDDGKQGVDDFLAAGGEVADFDRLARRKVFIPPEDDADRPRIVVTNRSLPDIVQDCWRCIQEDNERNLRTFERLGKLVRIDTTEETPVIKPWTEADTHFFVERAARFMKLVKRGDETIEMPARLPNDVGVDLLTAWRKPLPRLKAVVATPVVDVDGRVSVTPGYDAPSGLFYWNRGRRVEPVPEAPSADDIAGATNLIGYWIAGFPFDSDSSRAHAIAMALTFVVREMIDGPTPLFVIDAPTPGTGKTLLAEVVGTLLEGAPVAATSQPKDGDEWRKRITAILVEGRGVVVLDNLKRQLASEELATVLTAPVWRDRILGKTEMVAMPNRSLWIATGNNVQLDLDIARRSVWVRIDAKSEHPWEGRRFQIDDLRGWTREHREELMRAFLILVRNWVAAGMSAHSGPRLGMFERWCDVVGGILEAAAVPGFLANRKALYTEADPESGEWQLFVEAWWEEHGGNAVKVSDLVRFLQVGEELPTLVARIRGEPSQHKLSVTLGKALAERKGRRVGAWYVRWLGADKHQKGNMYRLEPAESDDREGGDSAETPQVLEGDSDSNAESAESAESVFEPRAREIIEAEWDAENAGRRVGKQTPQTPQTPQSGSESAFDDAESAAESGCMRAIETPRCRVCRCMMSAVAVGDICGRCKYQASRG
jgi:hypothetical protein